MGSFLGHLLPGTLFLFVGLWHLSNSIVKFVADPRSFKARLWHPIPVTTGRLRYLELYVIALGAFFDMCVEFFYSPHLKYIVDGALNSSHMNDFEHAAMLLMFFLFGIAALLSETTRWLPLPDGALHIIVAMAFTAEYLLFNFHSTNHAGLEGRYHQLLVLLIGLCIISALLGAAFPERFVVDLVCCIVITLQGLWFYQTAFTLYGPWMPAGCHQQADGPICESTESEIRGQSLANLQLSCLVSSLLVVVVVLYGVAARFWGAHDLVFFSSRFHSKGSEVLSSPVI
eukprot:c18572_g1_i1 orf=625-1482(-)